MSSKLALVGGGEGRQRNVRRRPSPPQLCPLPFPLQERPPPIEEASVKRGGERRPQTLPGGERPVNGNSAPVYRTPLGPQNWRLLRVAKVVNGMFATVLRLPASVPSPFYNGAPSIKKGDERRPSQPGRRTPHPPGGTNLPSPISSNSAFPQGDKGRQPSPRCCPSSWPSLSG